MAEHTAYDLLEMLRRHYQPEGKPAAGVFAPEIQAPASNRRADLIFLPTTVAGGTGIRGHEIKCSRSDLLNELRDPTKSDPWGKHCRHWSIIEQADSRLRDSPIYSTGVTDGEVISALVDRHAVAQIASTLRSDVNNLVQQITTACEPLRFTRERLAKLETESIVLNNRAARAVSGG